MLCVHVVCVCVCVMCVVECVSCEQMVYLVGSMMNTDVKTKKKLIKSSSNTALILWTEVIYRFHNTTRHEAHTQHAAHDTHTTHIDRW